MGIHVEVEVEGRVLGEPVGTLRTEAPGSLRGVRVDAEELPLVVDEVPLLAAIAAHADGGSRFEGAGELRVKESDRLAVVADGIRALGGDAAVERNSLAVGGGGLGSGTARTAGDHRIVMALLVAALAARGPCEVDDVASAAVSFPRFPETLRALGADVEVLA
jgi:3-phosphoshikimate 1-carboxyvinyltransferase